MKIALIFALTAAAFAQVPQPSSISGATGTPGTCGSPNCTVTGTLNAGTDVQINSVSVKPSYQTLTPSAGSVTGTAASTSLDEFNLGQLAASITSFTLNSLNAGEIVIIGCQQAAAAVYTIASPTGFPTISCASYPSVYTRSAFIWTGSAAIAIAPPATTQLYGQGNEVAAPSSAPPSGAQYCWNDSTSHTFECEDSSSNVYAMVKDVSAPAAGTYVSYIAQGVQHTSTVNNQVYKFGASFGAPSSGTALTTTTVGYSTPAPAACTITHWSLMVDTGTATVQFMKVASGTALPTHASNNISTSGVAISSGTVVDRSATLTDFTTTSVAAGDIIGVYLTTLSGPDYLAALVECQ